MAGLLFIGSEYPELDYDVDLEYDTTVDMDARDMIDVERDIEAWEAQRAAELAAMPVGEDWIPF